MLATHPSHPAFGSAVGLLLWLVLPASPAVQLAVIVAVFVLGAWGGSVAERHFGEDRPRAGGHRRSAGHAHHDVHEPGGGWVPCSASCSSAHPDIVKPYPANKLEDLHGGIGIMADDAMAGVLLEPCAARRTDDRGSDALDAVKAWILAVGSEMLTPFRVDTNSLAITEQLNRIGCDVRFKAVVGDDVDELAELKRARDWCGRLDRLHRRPSVPPKTT